MKNTTYAYFAFLFFTFTLTPCKHGFGPAQWVVHPKLTIFTASLTFLFTLLALLPKQKG